MRRGLLVVVMAACVAGGCARSGVDGAAASASGHAEAPSPRSAGHLATCVAGSSRPQPALARPSTGQHAPAKPDLDELRRHNEEIRDRYSPDEAFFRDRRPLAADVREANQPCADEVVRGLTLMGAAERYDAASVTLVLDGAGLTDITVRPAGQRDRAGSGGLLFAGWTGQACVFGEFRPGRVTAGVGDVVSGGGCLPD